jgi:hypothetical protein
MNSTCEEKRRTASRKMSVLPSGLKHEAGNKTFV